MSSIQVLDDDTSIIQRPDRFVGSAAKVTSPGWVWNGKKMVKANLTFSTAFVTVVNEIITNASDTLLRVSDRSDSVKLDFDKDTITVTNTGICIPLETMTVVNKDKTTYTDLTPNVVFTQLNASSNYDDSAAVRYTGGRNGVGAKITRVLSSVFAVTIHDGKQKYHRTWKKKSIKMGPSGIAEITVEEPDAHTLTKSSKGKSVAVTYNPVIYEATTFEPQEDYSELDADHRGYFARRAYDFAVCEDVSIYLNGKKLPSMSIEEYAKLFYTKVIGTHTHTFKDNGETPNTWNYAFMTIDDIKPTSYAELTTITQAHCFVSIINCLYFSGTANEFASKIINGLKNALKTKYPHLTDPDALAIVYSSVGVVLKGKINKVTFSGQDKNIISNDKEYTKAVFTKKFFEGIIEKCTVIESRVKLVPVRKEPDEPLVKTAVVANATSSSLVGIAKYSPAVKDSPKDYKDRYLFLCEGDSAKGSLFEGRKGSPKREYFGFYPLRGKVLNVRKNNRYNKEIEDLSHILGVEPKGDISKRRYGKIVIATDFDHDGNHIAGLLLNLFSVYWPGLLTEKNAVFQFITPIMKARIGKTVKNFYTMDDYSEWKKTAPRHEVTYYKGLGTSTKEEFIEYFADFDNHVRPFDFSEISKDINGPFERIFGGCSGERKTWLNMLEGDDEPLPLDAFDDVEGVNVTANEDDTFNAYIKSIMSSGSGGIPINSFINIPLKAYAIYSNHRAIPNLIDGFKPSQRKIMYMLMDLKTSVKVAVFASDVSKNMNYHHGEKSLEEAIFCMGHTFPGSNNIPYAILQGNLGSREKNGKDHAAGRYVFMKKNDLMDKIFVKADAQLYRYSTEDGIRSEPECMFPIIPMILVNGCRGMGTGYSSDCPSYSPADVISAVVDRAIEIKRNLMPLYVGYTGDIIMKTDNSFSIKPRMILKETMTRVNLEFADFPFTLPLYKYKSAFSMIKSYLEGNYTEYNKKNDSLVRPGKVFMARERLDNSTIDRFKFGVSIAEQWKGAEFSGTPVITIDDTIKVSFLTKADAEKFIDLYNRSVLPPLITSISSSNMHFFIDSAKIVKCHDTSDIISTFADFRIERYKERIELDIARLKSDIMKTNARIEYCRNIRPGLKRDFTHKELIEAIKHLPTENDIESAYMDAYERITNNMGERKHDKDTLFASYEYISSMTQLNTTKESAEKYAESVENMVRKVKELEETSPIDLWLKELRELYYAVTA